MQGGKKKKGMEGGCKANRGTKYKPAKLLSFVSCPRRGEGGGRKKGGKITKKERKEGSSGCRHSPGPSHSAAAFGPARGEGEKRKRDFPRGAGGRGGLRRGGGKKRGKNLGEGEKKKKKKERDAAQ